MDLVKQILDKLHRVMSVQRFQHYTQETNIAFAVECT